MRSWREAWPSTCNPLATPPRGLHRRRPGPRPPCALPACRPSDVVAPPFSDLLTRSRRPVDAHAAPPRAPEGSLNTPPGTRAIDMAPFNRADGWPTSMPIGRAPRRALVRPDLADIRHPERSVEADSAHRPLRPQHRRAASPSSPRWTPTPATRPRRAHRPPARAAALRRPRTSSRSAAPCAPSTARRSPPSPGFVALRDNTPSTDPRIEAARPRYEEVFTLPRAQGMPRNEVHLASGVHHREPRARARPDPRHARGGVPPRRDPDGIPFTISRVQDVPQRQRRAHRLRHLHPAQLPRRATTPWCSPPTAPRRCSRAALVPLHHGHPRAGAYGDAPLPLTIFGHGVFGRGEDYLTGDIGRVIQPLAAGARRRGRRHRLDRPLGRRPRAPHSRRWCPTSTASPW
jgi:hypothetical protein